MQLTRFVWQLSHQLTQKPLHCAAVTQANGPKEQSLDWLESISANHLEEQSFE